MINLARAFIAVDHPMRAEDEVYITASAVVGAIVGMLVFGALADALGRRAIFITTALLTTLGAFGSALVRAAAPAPHRARHAWARACCEPRARRARRAARLRRTDASNCLPLFGR